MDLADMTEDNVAVANAVRILGGAENDMLRDAVFTHLREMDLADMTEDNVAYANAVRILGGNPLQEPEFRQVVEDRVRGEGQRMINEHSIVQKTISEWANRRPNGFRALSTKSVIAQAIAKF